MFRLGFASRGEVYNSGQVSAGAGGVTRQRILRVWRENPAHPFLRLKKRHATLLIGPPRHPASRPQPNRFIFIAEARRY